MASKETSIKVGLDWTPNPLHAGLFVAQAKGYYSSAGLAVSLVSPSADGYATTPGKKVSTGELDLCLCPSETVISFQSSPSAQARIKACAALLSRDASAIVSRTATRPAELVGEGKQYASYGARYEDAIVQAMIDRDAGENKVGKLKTVTPAKLGIWETVIKGKCDSTWIFEPFEGVQARREGHKFHTFQLGDYGIPYGYSPLIAFNEASVASNKAKADAYRTFLRATGEGYAYAATHTDEAAEIVKKAMEKEGLSGKDTDQAFLQESMQAIAGYYNLAGAQGLGFGRMKEDVWTSFIGFLRNQGLLTDRSGHAVQLQPEQLYTNELLS